MLLLLAACGSGLRPPPGGPGAPTAAATVERFLQLADAREYIAMAYVFGTERGPYVEQVDPDVAERQMYLFSCVLGGLGREVLGELPIPGTLGRAMRFSVRLTQDDRSVTLPFRVVRGPDERWYLEQFDIEALTRSQLRAAPECLSSLRSRGAR